MGNRPDCAYFLLLGLCLAVFLLAVGGILTFNLTFGSSIHKQSNHFPHNQSESSHQQEKQIKTVSSPGSNFTDGETQSGQISGWNPLRDEQPSNETPGGTGNKYETLDSSLLSKGGVGESKKYVLAIIGPLCLLMGTGILVLLGVLALKYDCDHEPEPDIAFLRLKSELSLNFDPEKNNYELMRRLPISEPQQSSSSGSNMN